MISTICQFSLLGFPGGASGKESTCQRRRSKKYLTPESFYLVIFKIESMYTFLISCLLAQWMFPGSTYVLLLLGFINFFLGVFYFKKEWAIYAMKPCRVVFPQHYFILNYFFPVGLIQFSRASIVLLPGKLSLHNHWLECPKVVHYIPSPSRK